MKLIQFQIKNYRNIIDSGVVPIGQIAAIVGQNECGKSNLLEALNKLNPFQPEKYSLGTDWPIDRWSEQDATAIVCTAEFEIEQPDLEKLMAAAPPKEPRGGSLNQPVMVTVKKGYENKPHFEWNQVITGILDDEKANAWVAANMPKCVYMDDYATFEGRAELDALITKIDQHGLKSLDEREKTILITLELAALKLKDLHAKSGGSETRSLRGFDTSAASRHLTQQFKHKWRQKAVKFNIRVDGPTMDILVEDQGLEAFIPLDQRSRGFQWYVSFIWRFTYASKGQFANCILLLDEPGVHLHHEGHRDLVDFFKALAETNQLIYTTHLSTMLDMGAPEALKIMEVKDHHASVRNSMVSAQRVPMMVIEQALGLAAGMSGLLGARKNLVVEGVTDVLVLHKLSGVLQKASRASLRDDLYLIPARGASKTPMYAGFMMGNQIPAAVLLDSDKAGEEARKKIGELKVLATNDAAVSVPKVLMLGKVVDSTVIEIEDLFPLDFYLGCINEAYGTNLKESDLPQDGNASAAARIEVTLKAKGRATELDKELVAGVLQRRFQGMQKLDDLPAGTSDKAGKLIAAINAAF